MNSFVLKPGNRGSVVSVECLQNFKCKEVGFSQHITRIKRNNSNISIHENSKSSDITWFPFTFRFCKECLLMLTRDGALSPSVWFNDVFRSWIRQTYAECIFCSGDSIRSWYVLHLAERCVKVCFVDFNLFNLKIWFYLNKN